MVFLLTAATKATILTISQVLLACAPVVGAIDTYCQRKKDSE